MNTITVSILRYVDDAQPGWVECSFRDAWGREHLFREKVPVVSTADLDAASTYPQLGVIACEIIERWRDEKQRDLIKVSTDKPWGCESRDGTTCFDVLPRQLNTEPDASPNGGPATHSGNSGVSEGPP